MNSKCHRRASTSTFRPLLIIESAPLGPRISNLVRDHETAGHANNLGRIIVADELRTLTLRTQSSRPRTRRNSRYLFQRLSQVFFLMLLILLDRSEEHTSELQSLAYLVCRLLLEKKKKPFSYMTLYSTRTSTR